jgi:hypothetical protein
MTAYYNEIDPFKAEVIREAIKAGAIAPGDVDERSIADVKAAELVGYTQCHFFAGGGFWSRALRDAGWPDDRPVWTGSCPCPSFSAAGKGEGFADPRHLWPEWARLIRERRPASLFGEQVAAAIGHGWLDLVCTDLDGSTRSRLDQLPRQAQLAASGPTAIGGTAATASGGQLDPAYSRWLMGVPPEWDGFACTATQSVSQRRKRSSKRGLK